MRRHMRYLSVAGAGALVPLLGSVCVTPSSSAAAAAGASLKQQPVASAASGTINRRYAGSTIRILMPPWANMGPPWYSKFTKLTGIKVKTTFISFDTVHTKVVSAMSAGVNPADIIEVDFTWMRQFAQAGWLTPLNSYIPAGTIATAGSKTLFQYNGKQVAMPYSNDFRWVAVNMTFLKKAGIKKPPVTWAQTLADAKAVKKAGIVQYPIGFPLQTEVETPEAWLSLIKMSGGQVINKKGKPLFNAPSSLGYKALAFMRQAYKDGLVNPGYVSEVGEKVSADFAAGRVAILLRNLGSDGLSDPGQSKVAKDDIARITLGQKGPSNIVYGLPEGMGIPSNSTNKGAAAMFINWYNEIPQEAYMAGQNKYGGGGNLPPQEAAVRYLTNKGKLAAGKAIEKLTPHIVPLFNGGVPTWYPQWAIDAAAVVQAVVIGKESVSAGLNKLASELTTLESTS